MKKLFWGMIGIFLFLGQLAFAEEVNFGKLNPVLAVLAQAVVQGDDLVDFALPKFDEKYSSFKAEKLKYDLWGRVKNTPWLDGGKAKIQISTTYLADRTPSHLGISVGMDAVVKTDVMALLRYGAMVAWAKTAYLRDPNYYDPEHYNDRIDALLRRLSVATTLDEVLSLLQSGQELALEMIHTSIEERQGYIEEIEEAIQNGTRPDVGEAKAEIASIERDIELLKKECIAYKTTVFLTKGEGGKVSQISIINSQAQGFIPRDSKVYGENVSLILTPGLIHSGIKVFAPLSGEQMDDLKSRLEARLIGAQDGNAEDQQRIQGEFRRALIDFKNVIQGEF